MVIIDDVCGVSFLFEILGSLFLWRKAEFLVEYVGDQREWKGE
jgi:hypothetical protein